MKPNQPQKTLKENRLNNIVLRFIRSKLFNVNPVDEEYAKDFVKGEYDKFLKCIIENKLLNKLYHQYKLGIDVLEIVEDDSFYRNSTFKEFPTLFYAQPIENHLQNEEKFSIQSKLNDGFEQVFPLDGLAPPPNYKFMEDELPKVKAEFIALVKRYIILLELKNWIEKNGFSIPIIEFDSIIEELPSIDSTNSKDEEPEEKIDKDLMTVKSFLSFLVEEKICDEENYNKLVNLIYNFLVKDEDVALEDIVKLKYGSSKRLGSALGEIFREISPASLSYEYLLLGKKNINQFSKVKLNKEKFQKSTLYKYYADKKLCYKEFR
jgi:hypothetical protein